MELNTHNVKKHIIHLAANDMLEIAQRLFATFKLNYFAYLRVYPDNSILGLLTDRFWIDNYIEKNYSKEITFRNSGIYFWTNTASKEILTDCAINFNHDLGINIAKQCEGYIEMFEFAAPRENYQALEFFFNHMDMLNNFLFYFKDKANFLIKQALKEKFVFHDPWEIVTSSSDEFKRNFSRNLKINKIPLNFKSKNFYLTRREYEVILQLAQGKKIKEAARKLNISPKTVEFHLSNAKEKSHCIYSSQLIDIVRDNLIGKNFLDI